MSKLNEIEGRLSEAGSILAAWKSLIEHPGWKMYEKILEEQRTVRQLVLLEPLESFSKAAMQEFMKGEAAGIGLSSKLPLTQIELLELEVKRLRVEAELEADYVARKENGDVPGGRVSSGDWYGGAELPSAHASGGDPESGASGG